MKKLIILDRDGVLNKDRPNSVTALDQFEPIPGALEAVGALRQKGYTVVIATNQACIGRGLLTEEGLHVIHDHLSTLLKNHGGHIERFYFCPDKEPSTHRKPNPGMLLDALKDFDADASNTAFVGDALRDLQAAKAARCIPILVRTGKGIETEGMLAENNLEDVDIYTSLASFVDTL